MTQDNDPTPEPTLFSAIITPHRSLSRGGFLLIMLMIGGLSFAGGVLFFLVGAWPVVGFLGLDVLLVYLAFRANYRAATAYEQVVVTPSELRLKRVSHRGEAREWSMNPLWTRLERETHEDFGLLRLFLVSRGLRLAVASFLSPSERESFAHALSAALAEAKRGVTRTLL
ncbi:MAG TPA: DUF2244 domain-containing protein [Xanthobacteraceae bacterium]|jgi:uncharacterized membrane protein|nr:DUF2244 domain-containing protein [Xanthobacteraceae bacterium]